MTGTAAYEATHNVLRAHGFLGMRAYMQQQVFIARVVLRTEFQRGEYDVK